MGMFVVTLVEKHEPDIIRGMFTVLEKAVPVATTLAAALDQDVRVVIREMSIDEEYCIDSMDHSRPYHGVLAEYNAHGILLDKFVPVINDIPKFPSAEEVAFAMAMSSLGVVNVERKAVSDSYRVVGGVILPLAAPTIIDDFKP